MNELEAKKLIEQFAQKQDQGFFPCPRCGQMNMSTRVTTNATSRRVSCYICDSCGMEEALEDMTSNRILLQHWAIALDPDSWRMEYTLTMLVLQLLGRDNWDRPVYECCGKLYVDVDPRRGHRPSIYSKSGNEFNGEPDAPISSETTIKFVPCRDIW